jgi:SAM-dependent methyltransferase
MTLALRKDSAMASPQIQGARYDGAAEWYDERNAAPADANRDTLKELLGPGGGLCLDLGCGTGQNLPALRGRGRSVIGLDFSGDQLGLARQRSVDGEALVQAETPLRCRSLMPYSKVWLRCGCRLTSMTSPPYWARPVECCARAGGWSISERIRVSVGRTRRAVMTAAAGGRGRVV